MTGRYTRILCSSVLSFEALTLLFGAFVVGQPAAWVALACVVAAATLGRPWGYLLGHVVQIAAVALGVLSLAAFVIGVMFAALWITGYVIGLKIDRERAIR